MPDEDQLFLPPTAPPRSNRGRDDLNGIADDLDFIKVQLARIATRNEIIRCPLRILWLCGLRHELVRRQRFATWGIRTGGNGRHALVR